MRAQEVSERACEALLPSAFEPLLSGCRRDPSAPRVCSMLYRCKHVPDYSKRGRNAIPRTHATNACHEIIAASKVSCAVPSLGTFLNQFRPHIPHHA
eukprot:3913403-Rhodomonas_salina.1